jgi:thiamine biosynthesis lipoprotein
VKLLLSLLLFPIFLFAEERFSFEQPLMGTLFKITCYAPNKTLAEKAAKEAFAEAEKINEVGSDYIADSELLGLSKKPIDALIAVSPLLYQLVSEAKQMAELTDGAYDPTIGPFTKLWRESRRRRALPTDAVLASAKASTGHQHLICDSSSKSLIMKKAGMRLDLGGIAKGQAADAMLAVFFCYDLPSASITAGGDVRLGNPPPGAKGWQVGVRTFDKNKETATLTLANCAVSTSGDLQQSIEINGVHYAHIIDPATGLGLTKPVAATVIAPTATQSDALATACCILTPDAAKKLISRIPQCILHLPTAASEPQ